MLEANNFAVLGLGASGQAAANALVQAGKHVTIYDQGRLDENKLRVSAEYVAQGHQVFAEWNGEWAGPHEVLVTSPGVDSRADLFTTANAQGMEVWSEVELAYRISKAPIVAVTGTNGKSTTTTLTWLLLKSLGHQAILCGNISGSGYGEMPLSTAAAQSKPDQILVAEISSFQLEWVDMFKPVSCGIINIVPDHMNRYEEFQDYVQAKRNIFRCQKGDNYAIFNPAYPHTEPPNGPTPLEWGGEHTYGEITDEHIRILGTTIERKELKVLGQHNHENAITASLLAYGYECWNGHKNPDKQAALPAAWVNTLKEFAGIKYRMENAGTSCEGILFVNNSMCTNVEAVRKSVNSLPGVKHVLMGGINKELNFSPLAPFFASQNRAYLYGRDAAQIQGMLQTGEVFGTLQEAFAAAAKAAQPNETVILAPGCASMDQFKDFRERGDVFTQLAQKWIHG